MSYSFRDSYMFLGMKGLRRVHDVPLIIAKRKKGEERNGRWGIEMKVKNRKKDGEKPEI